MRLNLPVFSINLDKTRIPYINQLLEKTKTPISIYNASDGSYWWNSDMPRKHPWGSDTVTQGMMGCTSSHLDIMNIADQGCYIFEDDAELLLSVDLVNNFIGDVIKTTENDWDIILLGANEYVSLKALTQQITRVYRFWGTHAMIINKRAYDSIKKTFNHTLDEDVFLPADWLYNEAIRRYKLQVYAPCSPKLFFRQIPGLKSAITGKIRGA